MTNEDVGQIVCVTIIAGRKLKTPLTVALSEAGGRLINIVYGKGSAKLSYFRDMFGFVPEENKVVIICLMKNHKSDALFQMLTEKFHFDKPNTGIAFTIPLDGLSF